MVYFYYLKELLVSDSFMIPHIVGTDWSLLILNHNALPPPRSFFIDQLALCTTNLRSKHWHTVVHNTIFNMPRTWHAPQATNPETFHSTEYPL